jgi:hypothetical protein
MNNRMTDTSVIQKRKVPKNAAFCSDCRHLAPYWSDAPQLAAEYRLFLPGDVDIPGMGDGHRCHYPDPEPEHTVH